MGLVHACAHFPAILSIQETKSGDVPKLELSGHVCHGSKSGFAKLLGSEQFCTIKRLWKFEEICTAIVLEMYEACTSSIVKVLREGRRGGEKDFHITGDLNVELGMMCTDEKDIEELEERYGPLCCQGYDKDPGGFKN